MKVPLTTLGTSVNTYQDQLIKRMESQLVDYVLTASKDADQDIKKYKNVHLQQLDEAKESLIEKELLDIEREIEKRQIEIDRRTFDILSELLSDYGFDGTNSDVMFEKNQNKTVEGY